MCNVEYFPATSFDTWKVLNIGIMKKFYFVCHTNLTFQHECKNNYEGTSGGMEGTEVLNIYNRALHARGICYTKYLGDGAAEHTKGWLQGSPVIPT
jgi:hypothetical protein